MVSERKRKRYDIEKIHEFIDSASLPKQQMPSLYTGKNLESRRKKIDDEPIRSKKKAGSSDRLQTKSDSLTPYVIVRKKEPAPKKEEIMFQLVESPETEKRLEVFTVVRVVPASEDLFSEEALYEIETVTEGEEIQNERRTKELEPFPIQKNVTPTFSIRGGTGENLPKWEPVEEPSAGKEILANYYEKKAAVSLPEFERVDEDPAPPPSHDKDKMSSYESLEIEVAKEEKPQGDQSERKTIERKRLKKTQEKHAVLELKQKEREAKRLKKEQKRKVREEKREVQKRLQEEERLKGEEKKKVAAEAREKEREEQRLLKEREENLRIEQRNVYKIEKEERKRKMAKFKRTPPRTTPVVEEESSRVVTKSEEIPFFKSEQIPETLRLPQKIDHPIDSTRQPVEQAIPEDFTAVPEIPPAPQTKSLREDRQEQKRLRKEQKEKQRLERITLKKKEKEEQQQRKQEERPPDRFTLETIDKAEQKRKKAQEKEAQRDAKEQERQKKQQAKAQHKKEQLTIGAQDLALRRKEKEKQQQQKEEVWEEKQGLAELPLGESKEPRAENELQKAVEQQQEKEAEQKAVEETKEQRKLKAVERKMQKEQEKKEKEERKLEMIEDKKAKKKMELHFEEEIIKEKQSGTGERIDVFEGFDSIDQETATLLYKHGYTSMEKLLEATVRDLVKIGIKKKIAQTILIESKEFVEWKVFDADENPDGKSGGVF